MKYTRLAYDRADAELAARKLRSNEERAERLSEIRVKAPEIYELQRSLTASNYSILKAISRGDTRNVRAELDKIAENNLSVQQTIGSMLKAFGYDEDYLKYHYYCPICEDTGFHEGLRCSCYTKLLESYTTRELNESCSITLNDFSDFRLDLYPVTMGSLSPREHMRGVYADCRAYADNFSENSASLFFFGKTGLGKTFLSSCIAKQLLDRGSNVFFGSILKLLRQIEDERFRRKEGDTTEVIIGADLVILDDLGSEFQTSFTDSVLYEIINERINLNKPTIISTNLSAKELDNKYNDRIVSRLTGCFLPIMFIGSDVRQEKRKLGFGDS